MTVFTSLRDIPQGNIFREGDVFVLFGELFGRGYATSLVEEARKAGMTIIGTTVGRRDENNALRALTSEELAEAEANLGGRIINVPLMAGFDMDAPGSEPTPTDLLAGLSINSWPNDKLDFAHIEKCREAGISRFKNAVGQVMSELDGMIKAGSNIFFAHAMAGGILRTRTFLAIANRVYKGRGERFVSSRTLIESDLGKLMLMNFDEVTANTFQYLIDASAALRAKAEQSGAQVRYTAYGYHGTEILLHDTYQWQTYTNYTQGYAKMRLERIAVAAWDKGIKATVFNCPEIRTNSSDIFVGVELSLFALLKALKKEGGGAWADEQANACAELLQEPASLGCLMEKIEGYNDQDVIVGFRNFEAWPMDNTEQMAEIMIGTSDAITQMHKDRKKLITDHLSALVVEATGHLIFKEAANPSAPVLWLNHDIIAKQLSVIHN